MRTSTLVLVAILVAVALLALPHLARSRPDPALQAAAKLVERSVEPAPAGHELVERELGFRATFPGSPRREPLPTGGSLFAHASDAGFYALGVQDIPQTAAESDLDLVLAGGVQGLLATIPDARGLQIIPCFEVPGARGVDVQLEMFEGGHTMKVRARVLARPGRLFIMNVVTGVPGVGDGFIESFVLMPALDSV